MKNSLFLIASLSMLTATTQAQSVPSYVPTSGLVGWWPFNNNANDESGSGHNGTVSGAVLTTDRFSNANSAYDFTAGSITSSPQGVPVSGPMSVSVWIRPSSNYGIGEFICLGSSGSSAWGVVGGNNAFTVNYGRNCGSTGSSLQAIPLDYSNWHHVVYVSSGLNSTADVYYDGQFVGTSTTANSGGSCSTAALNFGVDVYFNSFYPGKLDDIGIWNRKLTACEIRDLFNSSFTNCNGVSVTEHPPKGRYLIYPNPSDGNFNLKGELQATGEPFEIYDYTGKVIRTGSISPGEPAIDLSAEAAGIYLINIGNGHHCQKLRKY